MRLELTRPNGHYPLKVARLPIPPLLHNIVQNDLCPEQDSNLHVSQHSHLKRARLPFRHLGIYRLLPLSGKRGSNSRPQPWQGCALPTELFPRLQHELVFYKLKSKFQRAENEARTRDPNLGKVVLYQLSYFRVYFVNLAFLAALIA